MAILRKIIILSLPLLLTGCYEDFEPLIDTKPMLCLNSLITAGEPIEVSVTRTWVYTDEKGEFDHSVKDATVQIYANGQLTDTDYIPLEGDTIRIEAYSDTYGAAEAEVIVPNATQITDLIYRPIVKNFSYADTDERGISADFKFNLPITLTLPNHKGNNSYYSLIYNIFFPKDLIYTDEEDDPQDLTRRETNPVLVGFYEGSYYCKDQFFSEFIGAFDDVMDYGEQYRSLYFSNRQFEGKTKDLHIGFENCSFNISKWDGNPKFLDLGFVFTLYSISESYYNWMNYRWQSAESISGEFAEFGLAEQMWGYSNVSTGAGVVAARSSSTFTVSLKDFLEETLATP